MCKTPFTLPPLSLLLFAMTGGAHAASNGTIQIADNAVAAIGLDTAICAGLGTGTPLAHITFSLDYR